MPAHRAVCPRAAGHSSLHDSQGGTAGHARSMDYADSGTHSHLHGAGVPHRDGDETENTDGHGHADVFLRHLHQPGGRRRETRLAAKRHHAKAAPHHCQRQRARRGPGLVRPHRGGGDAGRRPAQGKHVHLLLRGPLGGRQRHQRTGQGIRTALAGTRPRAPAPCGEFRGKTGSSFPRDAALARHAARHRCHGTTSRRASLPGCCRHLCVPILPRRISQRRPGGRGHGASRHRHGHQRLQRNHRGREERRNHPAPQRGGSLPEDERVGGAARKGALDGRQRPADGSRPLRTAHDLGRVAERVPPDGYGKWQQ